MITSPLMNTDLSSFETGQMQYKQSAVLIDSRLVQSTPVLHPEILTQDEPVGLNVTKSRSRTSCYFPYPYQDLQE